jgi:hypothetical protein
MGAVAPSLRVSISCISLAKQEESIYGLKRSGNPVLAGEKPGFRCAATRPARASNLPFGEITMQPLYPMVDSEKLPRDILTNYFECELPISGGWGYSMDDACIINKFDPLVDPSLPFNGVGLEYIFVEKRIYAEMITFRPEGERFFGIKWNLQMQGLCRGKGGKSYDKLVFEITALQEKDREELKAEFEGPQGYVHPEFDFDAHMKKYQERTVRFTREFWFDITSFFGK